MRLRLVDALAADVAVGTVGEIGLQALNLMRSHHRLPAGAGFVAAWFATGDPARADAGRWVTGRGRSKGLSISGSEHIHPAETENLAVIWPGVADAAVVGLPDACWGEVRVLVRMLVRMLVRVAQAGPAIDLDALRGHLAQRLARFKQPRRIVVAEAVPRTALGTVQKAALRQSLSVATS